MQSPWHCPFMRRSIRNINIPSPPGKPRAFELLKIDLFKFPPPWADIAFKYPSTGFDCQMPLLKIKCFQWSTNVAKIFSKGLDSFLVELVLGFEQIASSAIPRGENLSVIYPLFISYVFDIATDKCFLKYLTITYLTITYLQKQYKAFSAPFT